VPISPRLRRIDIAALDFPLLRSQREWEAGTLPPALAQAQEAVPRCEHMVLIFPLWLGDMPALVKGFLEQVLRPGFALTYASKDAMPNEQVGRSHHRRGPATTAWSAYFSADHPSAAKCSTHSRRGSTPISAAASSS